MKKKSRIDRRMARAWMVMEGIRPCDIQDALGQRSHAHAVETLSGVRSDKKVLNWLLNRGCPEEYLQLPKQMQGGK
jgi:hypothetical protein